MPYKFSARSRGNLQTCHNDLIMVAEQVIQVFDFTVIEGHRGKIRQNDAFNKGLSKLQFPDSKHNLNPAEAAHFIPYPINWRDRERMTLLAGHIVQAGFDLGITIRWGGDWDQDREVADNRFDDLTHFELVNKR